VSSRTSSEPKHTPRAELPLFPPKRGELTTLCSEEAARRPPAATAHPKAKRSKGERTGAVFRTGDECSINDDAADDTTLHLRIRWMEAAARVRRKRPSEGQPARGGNAAGSRNRGRARGLEGCQRASEGGMPGAASCLAVAPIRRAYVYGRLPPPPIGGGDLVWLAPRTQFSLPLTCHMTTT